MVKKETIAATLLRVASEKHLPTERALDNFLDYAIEAFDMNKFFTHDSYEKILMEARDKCIDYFHVVLDWFKEVDRAMCSGTPCDFFGMTYETMFQSKAKASTTGQFFTPPSICDLMADLVESKSKDGGPIRVNDCCCGSGRLLLSHYMKNSTPEHCGQSVGYYVAQDIDPVSCKMCALNMMAHGMIGEVHCQDTLLLTPPTVSYYINEVRTPFPTPYYSIRKVVKE